MIPTLIYFVVQSGLPHLNATISYVFDALDSTDIMDADEHFIFDTYFAIITEFVKIFQKLQNPLVEMNNFQSLIRGNA